MTKSDKGGHKKHGTTAEVEIFYNGTEGQFLVFKRNLMQTIAEVNL